MKINSLNIEKESFEDHKLHYAKEQFVKLIQEIDKQKLPDDSIEFINDKIKVLNSISATDKSYRELLRKTQSEVLKMLEKQHKIVSKNHYLNKWLLVGMNAVGLPIGAALGISLNNIALLGIGLPIGMIYGYFVGKRLDKKAQTEGRQLDIELKLTF